MLNEKLHSIMQASLHHTDTTVPVSSKTVVQAKLTKWKITTETSIISMVINSFLWQKSSKYCSKPSAVSIKPFHVLLVPMDALQIGEKHGEQTATAVNIGDKIHRPPTSQ